MPEELASYHVPDGKPKHVAPVNLLARLKEAEAQLKAAREKAAQEAAAKAQAEEAARQAAERQAKNEAKAAHAAERRAKHDATKAKLQAAEQELGRQLKAGKAFGVIAVVTAGLAFGLLLIVTYELLNDRNAPGPTPSPTPVSGAGRSEVVPFQPSPGSSANQAEPVNPANGTDRLGNPVPDRGTPPGQE